MLNALRLTDVAVVSATALMLTVASWKLSSTIARRLISTASFVIKLFFLWACCFCFTAVLYERMMTSDTARSARDDIASTLAPTFTSMFGSVSRSWLEIAKRAAKVGSEEL
jgi:hypothetical protein